VWFLPDRLRAMRNLALYVCVVELFVSLGSLPFAAARTSLSRASSGIHGALVVVSLLGLVGGVRLSGFALTLHALLAVGIPAVFALFMILTLTASQGVREPADAVVIVIFISLVWDVVAGAVSGVTLWRLNAYTAACQREHADLMRRVEEAVREGTHRPAPPAVVARPPAEAGQRENDAATPQQRLAQRAGLQEVEHRGGMLPPPNHGAAVVQGVESGGGRCNVCVSRRRDTAFVPCGHMACGECARMVEHDWGRCHACREPIAGVVRVYVT